VPYLPLRKRIYLNGKDTAACYNFAGCFFLRLYTFMLHASDVFHARFRLYIVVKVKFMGMRPQLDIVDFIFDFVVNPHINGILGEYIPFHEKLLIGL
jgi:hypothetical protein